MRRSLLLVALCLAMLCNPAHAINPNVFRRLFPKAKPSGPRQSFPEVFPNPYLITRAARSLESLFRHEEENKRGPDYLYRNGPWSAYSSQLPEQLLPNAPRFVYGTYPTEFSSLIDSAVIEYGDYFRAIHGEEAWSHEKRRITKDVAECTMALRPDFVNRGGAAYRFPPAEHLARDPYRSINGAFLSPVIALYAARPSD